MYAAAICVHPPYPVLVVVFILAGFGNGLGDSGWCVDADNLSLRMLADLFIKERLDWRHG